MCSIRPNVPKGIDKYKSQHSSLKRAACMPRPLFSFLARHLGADFSCHSPICCTSRYKSSAKLPDGAMYVCTQLHAARRASMPCCVWLAIVLEVNPSDFVNTIGCFVSILRIGPGLLGSCGRFWVRWTPGHLDSVFGVDGHKRSSFFWARCSFVTYALVRSMPIGEERSKG